MDKDWAEKEAYMVFKKWNDAAEFANDSGLIFYIADALRKVRREAIESCAVIAETNKAYPFPTSETIAKAIRESEGKV